MKIGVELNLIKVLVVLAIAGISSGSGYFYGADVQFRTDMVAERTCDCNCGTDSPIMTADFCEKIGLVPAVYWQQDLNGNIFGLPICVQGGDVGG